MEDTLIRMLKVTVAVNFHRIFENVLNIPFPHDMKLNWLLVEDIVFA
jgi:hypothetical protein